MRHDYKSCFQNVEIRQLMEEDLEFLRLWRNNPNNTKYLNQIPYITPEMQEKWFYQYLENEGEITFAIDETVKLHKIVGSISLYNLEPIQAEVGKVLVGEEKAHGMNVCTNALKAIMGVAKNDLRLRKLYLHVYKDNVSAVKAYEKAGFEIVSEHDSDNGLTEYLMDINL